jgi:hypothetical protein
VLGFVFSAPFHPAFMLSIKQATQLVVFIHALNNVIVIIREHIFNLTGWWPLASLAGIAAKRELAPALPGTRSLSLTGGTRAAQELKSKVEAANWYADTFLAFSKRDIAGLIEIKSLNVGSVGRPVGDIDAELRTNAEKWQSDPVFEQTVKQRLAAKQWDTGPQPVTMVLKGELPSKAAMASSLFKLGGRRLIRIMVEKAEQQAYLDSLVEEMRTAGISQNVQIALLDATDIRDDIINVDRLEKRFGAQSLYILSKGLSLPDRVSILIEDFAPVQLRGLSQMDKILRAAMSAA